MQKNKFVLYVILLSTLFQKANAQDVEDKKVNLNISTSQAQVVAMPDRNKQVVDLKKEENKLLEEKAKKEGNSFIPSAPDKADPNYWATMNNNNDNAVKMDEKVEQIDNDRLVEEKQAYKTILDDWNKQKSQFVSVEFPKSKAASEDTKNAAQKQKFVKALAGTRWYATLAGGADSYVPGPVRVQIQEGPFAGGYALGKFQIAPDGEHLILMFDTLSDSKQTYSISAVAVDPKSEISGVTGDIDHHFFRRYVVPLGVGFLQGAVNLMNTNQSVVTNASTTTVTGPQLSDARLALVMASKAADKLEDATRLNGVLRLPQVKLEPGEGIGFLLLKAI